MNQLSKMIKSSRAEPSAGDIVSRHYICTVKKIMIPDIMIFHVL